MGPFVQISVIQSSIKKLKISLHNVKQAQV
jgi:hypothetical protein